MTASEPTKPEPAYPTTEASRPLAIRLLPFTLSFVTFGLGISAAMLLALVEQNLNLYRARFTIRVSLILALPAFILYVLGLRPRWRWITWRFFWMFSYLAYLVHFYYSLRAFHFNINHIIEKQSLFVAVNNFVLTAWWGIDVILSWSPLSQRRWVGVERFLATVVTFINFYVAAVVFKHGFVRSLGIATAVVVAACVLARGLDALFGGHGRDVQVNSPLNL